jgi:hypothetical protein
MIDYCYGTTSTNDPRWHELKQSEEKFMSNLPPTFAPIYYCEPNRSRGEVFPEIWYLDDWHATGAQHMELARILLAVHVSHHKSSCLISWKFTVTEPDKAKDRSWARGGHEGHE